MSIPSTARLAIGGLLGACGWPIVHLAAPWLPEPLQFLVGWFVFTIGPGFAAAGYVARTLDPLRRVIVLLGAGSAATAVLINLLGRAGLVPAFPYLAFALSGMYVASGFSRTQPAPESDLQPADGTRRDAFACAALVALSVAIGVIVFWHRLWIMRDGIMLYGDYDTADMSWYAAVASEASHTIPPMAPYYSGHQLNAAYYPHLVQAMVHRYLGVPVL